MGSEGGRAGEPLRGGCGAEPCDPIDPNGSIAQVGGRGRFSHHHAVSSASLWAADGSEAPATAPGSSLHGWRLLEPVPSRVGLPRKTTSSRLPWEGKPPVDLWLSNGTPEGTFRLASALGAAAPSGSLEQVREWRGSGDPVGFSRLGWGSRPRALAARPRSRIGDRARRFAPGQAWPDGSELARRGGRWVRVFSIAGDQGETTVVRRNADGLAVEVLFSLPAL